jgi:hypothetical protein
VGNFGLLNLSKLHVTYVLFNYRASARQVQVTLGDYVINSAVEPLPAYTFGVREIRVHPYFKFTPQADRFDVAVLRLDRPVQYMPHIAPICLPEKGEDFLGQYGWAAGWGALQAGMSSNESSPLEHAYAEFVLSFVFWSGFFVNNGH